MEHPQDMAVLCSTSNNSFSKVKINFNALIQIIAAILKKVQLILGFHLEDVYTPLASVRSIPTHLNSTLIL